MNEKKMPRMTLCFDLQQKSSIVNVCPWMKHYDVKFAARLSHGQFSFTQHAIICVRVKRSKSNICVHF